MKARIEKKITNYISSYKDEIKNKALELGILETENGGEFIQYILDKENLRLSDEDFVKRKRNRNSLTLEERCIAKRANGECCTRRKKIGCEFCGTHTKGQPFGLSNTDNEENTGTQNVVFQACKKIEIFTQEINGIIYHLDNIGNVYHTEDIMKKLNNPRIICKYKKSNNEYVLIK